MAGLFGGQRRLPNVDARAMGIEPQPYAGVQFAPQQAQPKGDGTKRIVGIIGDALLGLAGQQGVYGPMQHQRKLLEAREAAQQRSALQQRQWGNEDWLQRQQWERANPPPRINDTIEDFNWYKSLSPEDRATYDQMHPVYRTGPDGLPYPMARPLAPPTRPVGKITPIEPMGAPSSGGNFMTPAQFQAIVAAKGQAAATEWARRNNIQIRN